MCQKKSAIEKHKKNKHEQLSATFASRIWGKHSWHIMKRVQICGAKGEALKSVSVFVMKRGSCLSLQSLGSQDTQAVAVLIFHKENQKKENGAPALAWKISPGSFVAGIAGNISGGPIRSELQRRRQSRQWIVAIERSKSSK